MNTDIDRGPVMDTYCKAIVATVLTLLVLSSGCASSQKGVSAPASAPAAKPGAACNPQRDASAIVAMAGSYDVDFSFEESAVITPGYEKHGPQRSA